MRRRCAPRSRRTRSSRSRWCSRQRPAGRADAPSSSAPARGRPPAAARPARGPGAGLGRRERRDARCGRRRAARTSAWSWCADGCRSHSRRERSTSSSARSRSIISTDTRSQICSRVSAARSPAGGRFVLGDVVVPDARRGRQDPAHTGLRQAKPAGRSAALAEGRRIQLGRCGLAPAGPGDRRRRKRLAERLRPLVGSRSMTAASRRLLQRTARRGRSRDRRDPVARSSIASSGRSR